MFRQLKKLKKSDKIWLSLFTLLLLLVIVTAATHKSTAISSASNSVSNKQATQQQNKDSNYDDASNDSSVGSSSNTQTEPVQPIQSSSSAVCHINGVLPDTKCTPGSVDPRVTQANIHQTICVSGYTKTVRPSSSYTSKLKIEQIQEYGYTDTSTSDYEEDHLISLELGGSPDDVKNLWPEPGASPNTKDKTENQLHSLVCDGSMTLADAQVRIATNWTTALSGY